MSKIETFKEVFDWIVYDWDHHYNLNRSTEGNFYVNKLYIAPTYLSYKTERYELKEGLFQKVEKLYRLINGTKLEKLFDGEDYNEKK